jgi:putative ABC transport system permease protein
VAIVNQTAARLYRRSPVGAYLSLAKGLQKELAERPRRIVGVVGDIRKLGPDQEPAPTVFVPLTQVPDGLTLLMNRAFRKAFVVRAASTSGLMARLRRVIPAELSVASARTMTEIVGNAIARLRFQTFLMVLFGGFALLLTGVGIYGVLSFQVSHRSQELGIRMSLGARSFQLASLLLRQTVFTTAAGVAGGTAGAAGLTRVLASMLYGIRATDPATFAGGALGITAVALLASYLPVRQAIQRNPLAALRSK